ncbi:MAG: RNA methyltransferase [Tannerellaceae bacterium]|jgi:TrmH family RNA methyltransferase|nr:RNA methyltransferase [Tannerellaceae bacterium]
MLSKNKIRYVRSLESKKFRNAHNAFLAEGNKLVSDVLGAFECEWMLAKPSWMATQGDIPAGELLVDEYDEISKVSLLSTPQDVIAVFRRPAYDLSHADASASLVLALDGVQDPGNLGTIVRLADWFGIEHVVCSPDTADVFAPKAIQATMGAIARVQVHYTPLESFLKAASENSVPVYGTFMSGESLYGHALSEAGVIVMGNEGGGIRPEAEQFISHRLHIPAFAPGRATSESLNVAIATAIVCSEFRRPRENVS